MKNKQQRGIDMLHKNVWLVSFVLLIVTIGMASAGGLNVLSVEGDNQGTTGNFATVYINATGVDNIGSLQLDVLYNPNVINANSVTVESLATGTSGEFNIDNTTGKVTMAFITSGGMTGDGPLAKINFSVVGSAGSSSPLDINVVDITDIEGTSVAPGNIVNSTFTVTGDVVDKSPPVINSVSLDTYTPNTGDNVIITADIEDNIGVANVSADIYEVSNVGVSNVAIDHVELSEVESVWSGTIVARNGTYNVKVSASDAAGNVAFDNSTSYTGTDKPTLAFEFGVSNSALTVEQNETATYVLTIKNNGQISDTYDLTVNTPDNATVNLSENTIGLAPGENHTATLEVSSQIVGNYVVNVTATSRENPSANIAVSTETIVVIPSYIKAFYVGNGNRSGSIKTYVKITNLDDVGHWFVVVIGGIDPLTGYPLVGTGTLYLEANNTAEKVPVLIPVPAGASVGTYKLYVGIYNYDKGLLDQSTIIGAVQGPKSSIVS